MKIKTIVFLLLVLAGAAVSVMVVSNKASTESTYQNSLAQARNNAQREIPYTACSYYKDAFAIRNDDEGIYKEYLAQTEKLGEDFYEDALLAYPTLFPTSVEAYERVCDYYYDREQYYDVIETADAARLAGAVNEKIKSYYYECFYKYEFVRTDLEEAESFLGTCARIKEGGMVGYLYQDGTYLIAPVLVDGVTFCGSTTAVNDGEEWYMTNIGGYKVARTDVPVDELSYLSEGRVLFKKKGKYGYMTSALKLPESWSYEDACNFRGGVAAAKKNGKWALIDTNENPITDFIYDDVVVDEFGSCCVNGRVFVKSAGKYFLLNSEGKAITETAFEDVRPFVGDEPAAVRIDGKWGFLAADGTMAAEATYDEAGSYSNGLAAVKKDDVWSYIDRAGVQRVTGDFVECKPFASNGIAAVKLIEGDMWCYIQLYPYYYNR